MNVSAIGTDDGKSTFEVQRTWNEKGKKAIAIGMYPTISVENCGMLDVSNMHLLNHANDFGWGELRMLNLYATVVNGKPTVQQFYCRNNSLLNLRRQIILGTSISDSVFLCCCPKVSQHLKSLLYLLNVPHTYNKPHKFFHRSLVR